MKSITCIALLAVIGCGAPSEELVIEGAEVRVAPVAAVTAAAYFTLQNAGPVADTITAIGSDIADSLSLHESMDHGDGNTMMMPLAWLAVPAGERVTLAPGGKHLMIEGLTRPIAPGDSIRLTLSFSSGRRLEVIAPVRAVGGEE